MNRNLCLVAVLAALAVGACKSPNPADEAGSAPAAKQTEEAPLEQTYAAEVGRAQQIFQRVGSTLMGRLTEAMAQLGAPAAISVCKVEAPVWTSRATEGTGIEAGRTSHALRSPDNAPRAWMEPFVKEGAGKPASELGLRVVDLGDKVGVAAPIAMKGLCVTCHGDAAAIPEPVSAAIAQKYPNDKARGFKEGDLRGWFWAEVPKPH